MDSLEAPGGTATAALAIKGELEFWGWGWGRIGNFSVQLGSLISNVFRCELEETSKGQRVFPPGAGS